MSLVVTWATLTTATWQTRHHKKGRGGGQSLLNLARHTSQLRYMVRSCSHLGDHTGVNPRQGDHGLSIPNTKNYLIAVALLGDHSVNRDTLKN